MCLYPPFYALNLKSIGEWRHCRVFTGVVEAMTQEKSIEELEERIDELEREVQSAREYADAAHRRVETMKTGLLELQVRELQTGTMLSTDGIDDYTLSEDLGLDVSYVGDEHQYVRLENPDDVGDEDAMAASLPNSSEMCQLEQLRQVWRRGLMNLEELGPADVQRAILVWDNADVLAEETGTGNSNWRITSEKVRRIIDKNENVDSSSLYELARRTMQKIPDLTDGTLQFKKDDGLYLVGEKEHVQSELKPLYESTSLDDGSNIVVRR